MLGLYFVLSVFVGVSLELRAIAWLLKRHGQLSSLGLGL